MANKKDDNGKYNVKIVSRCLSILDFAAQNDGPFSVQQIMTALDLNTNMAYRLLTTMTTAGYLEKDENTSLYTASLKFVHLFNRALSSLDIRKIALPYMEMLSKHFPKANINLALLFNYEVLQTDRIDSQSDLRTYFTPGKKIPFYASGLGKVLASELYPEEIEKMIDKVGGFKDLTVHTIVDHSLLMAELKKVREQGYAIDRQELILHDNCNAAPIRNSAGKIIAAVSMSAFDNAITREEMDANIHFVCETARQISYFLGYSGV
ncbi:IclR family transcriptional regulator [Treponema parvum]|uniref:IclR family transcriptional regulator n=1 Tax=Treponema parvum TaxID=138851 RepID=UPI001AEC5403|nr:IclR family transcriptional regulator [Treponema parvum]QTQ17175.1 IclR family transcriptional regulator [Treponema parvum]